MTKQEVLAKVIEEAKLRGLSVHTQEMYYGKVKKFQEYYNKSATELDLNDVRDYLCYLTTEAKLSSGTINIYNSGLRFLYSKVLHKHVDEDLVPRQKNTRQIPEILTCDEVQLLLNSCGTLRNKAMIMTAYSSGLRLSEVINLRIKDIDSENMQLFIRQGKGKKDRFAILSQINLEVLREYWIRYKPKEYLFLTYQGKKMSGRAFQVIVKNELKNAGITKRITPHSLRHSFATHLLENGTDVYHIMKLLGHADIRATCFYLRMVKIRGLNVQSPLDSYLSEADE